MARDPGSMWAPLPEAGAPDGYTKTQFIVHSTGDNAAAINIRGYFSQTGVVVESTFVVGKGPEDPTLQIMDSTDNADANGSANQRAISVEVVGDGIDPFTDWQVKEIIRIGRWAAANHPIALRVIPSEPESGFGWHVMFGAPGPWTSSVGKICPGPARITQLRNHIFPAIFTGGPIEEDSFMASLSEVQQREMYAWLKNLAAPLKVVEGEPARPRELVVKDIFLNARSAAASSAKAAAVVDPKALAAEIVKLLPAGSVDRATVTAALREVFADAGE